MEEIEKLPMTDSKRLLSKAEISEKEDHNVFEEALNDIEKEMK